MPEFRDESGGAASAIRTWEVSMNPASAPRDASAARLLQGLCELAGHLDQFEAPNEALELPSRLAALRALGELVSTAAGYLETLQAIHEDGEDELDFPAEPPTVDGLSVVVPALPRLADVCFAGRLELNRALRELNQAATIEEVLAAQETAARKLHRAIRAVFEAARERGIADGNGAERLRQRGGADLAAALTVRRLYAEFRCALRTPTDASSEAVLTSLRYAAGALSTLISSPSYANARVTDRALLRRLHQRLVAWARAGKTAEEGLDLLDDIRTCAELLRGINRRQELREHDTKLIGDSCAVLSDASAWFERLLALRGLDDSLDSLLERSERQRTARLADEIVLRLLSLR